MSSFLEAEKARQTSLKQTSSLFSEAARADGVYKGKPRSFCLRVENAEENLFPDIRRLAMEYFAAKGIHWHDGKEGKPSNHLCSSQVCCVNFLAPFADKPDSLADLLRPVFPNVKRMVPMEDSGEFVSFEWIGEENYLGEMVPEHGRRTRGARCTSADASVMFETTDGTRHIVLIEWKYTESYHGTPLKVSRGGKDRAAIYAPLFNRDDCPVNKDLLPSYESLFYEPFYQLFRQQMLANEMAKASELGADTASVLHIATAANRDFREITSPELRSLGESATGVWRKLLREPDRFRSISTEELFGTYGQRVCPELGGWWEYTAERYSWLSAG